MSTSTAENYNQITDTFLFEKAASDKQIVGISPGTPMAGFNEFRSLQVPRPIYGCGDCLASGIASQGGKPVASIFSSLIQRAYDKLSQDLANKNNPALILVQGGNITGTNVTHLGVFDIPLISNIPNIVYLAPTSKEEYLAMMEWEL